jgi:hypothetical protein
MKKLIALFVFVLLSGLALAQVDKTSNVFTLGVTCPGTTCTVTTEAATIGSIVADATLHTFTTPTDVIWTVNNWGTDGKFYFAIGGATYTGSETVIPTLATGTVTTLGATQGTDQWYYFDSPLCNTGATIHMPITGATAPLGCKQIDYTYTYTLTFWE